jgi:hypothetical protein
MSQTPFVLDTDLESVRPNDLFVYSPEQRDISIRSRAEMNDLEITNDGFHVEESEADDFLAELTGPGTLMNFRRGGFYCESIEAELEASEDVRETISGLEARFDEKGYDSSYFICTNSAEPLPLPQLRDDIGSNNIVIELDNHDQLAWAEYDPQRNKLYGYSTTSIDIVDEGTQKDLEGEKRTELEQIARNEDLEFSVLKAGNAQYNHSH